MKKSLPGDDSDRQRDTDPRYFSIYLCRPGSRTEEGGCRPTIRVHKITTGFLISALLWIGIIGLILWAAMPD
jgi:hypothetical protein